MELEEFPDVRVVQEHWDSLHEKNQDEIWDDFQQACIEGGLEPSDYWYPLLMPRFMEGYVGD